MVQEPHTINKVKIAELKIILLGVQKRSLVPGGWSLERIVIPNMSISIFDKNIVFFGRNSLKGNCLCATIFCDLLTNSEHNDCKCSV